MEYPNGQQLPPSKLLIWTLPNTGWQRSARWPCCRNRHLPCHPCEGQSPSAQHQVCVQDSHRCCPLQEDGQQETLRYQCTGNPGSPMIGLTRYRTILSDVCYLTQASLSLYTELLMLSFYFKTKFNTCSEMWNNLLTHSPNGFDCGYYCVVNVLYIHCIFSSRVARNMPLTPKGWMLWRSWLQSRTLTNDLLVPSLRPSMKTRTWRKVKIQI